VINTLAYYRNHTLQIHNVLEYMPLDEVIVQEDSASIVPLKIPVLRIVLVFTCFILLCTKELPI
jgi:hypothetical protein